MYHGELSPLLQGCGTLNDIICLHGLRNYVFNIADVVSAQQELQQWKDEIKKTMDEYHTTEGK